MTVDAAQPLETKLSVDDKFHRTYTSTFQVIADKEEGPFKVGSASGLPLYGASYVWYSGFDLWSFARDFQVERVARIKDKGIERAKWIVTITYTSQPSDGSNNNKTPRDNPLDDPPVISGSFNSYTFPAYRDKNQDLISNSARGPYVPPPNSTGRIDTVKISYNTANIDLPLRSKYLSEDCVNSDSIWGLDPRQAKIVRWDYQILYAGNNFSYIKNNFEFHISFRSTVKDVGLVCTGKKYANKFGWYTVLPNRGEYYVDGGLPAEGDDGFTEEQKSDIAQRTKKFMDANDQPLSAPGKLDCSGDRLPSQSDPQKWNIYAIEQELAFTAIPGMPNPLPIPTP
jgi:hypothetical protein